MQSYVWLSRCNLRARHRLIDDFNRRKSDAVLCLGPFDLEELLNYYHPAKGIQTTMSSDHAGHILLFIVLVQSSLIISIESCQRILMSNVQSLTKADQEKIIDAHNALRQAVALGYVDGQPAASNNALRQAVALGYVDGQPAASNMQEMRWDDELAARAQTWALSCDAENHDPHRDSSRFRVGQNIATFWTTRKPTSQSDTLPEFKKAINGWFKEVDYYNYNRIVGHGGTGHYTQMVWADTNLVGCGYAFYYDARKGYTKNYICNYGPGGNIITEFPYDKGYPLCRNYGLEYSRRWKGLCVSKPKNIFQFHIYR
ncbi:Cysteine-rich secretory protein family [Popillia japonica]|uniref:Cysteine-rich secretory protein family n=1 Tax=Popillia japonica TaxID=7064 RepID=A0AAW1JHR6_POPJA